MLIAARNAMLAGGGSQPSGGYWGLCFTAEQANSTVAMTGRGSSATGANLLYSTDPTDPTSWTQFIVGTTTITLANVGDKVWLKAGTGGNTGFYGGRTNYARFSLTTGLVIASGNIMSLIDGDSKTQTIPSAECFALFFQGCTSLATAPSLPATTLAGNCYRQMFNGCTALTAISVGFTDFNSVSYTNGWLNNVAATGTFYCPTALGTDATITRGTSACPAGWTVVNTDA